MKIKKKRSLLKYFGGKYHLLKYILPFPQHKIYVEPFGGSGVVLVNKVPSVRENFSDINRILINFWMVLKDYRVELKEKLEYLPDSRELFEKFISELEQSKEKIMDLDNAFKFFYINYHSYSGNNLNYIGMNFSPDFITFRNVNNVFLEQISRIDEIWKRIRFVHFECQDFRKLLKRVVDKKYVLLYLDPPYIKSGVKYQSDIGGYKWKDNDYYDLFKILRKIKNARFVLSFDDISLFDCSDWFYQKIKRINWFKQTNKKTHSTDYEYVIRNFDPERTEIMRSKKDQTLLKYIKDV